MTQAASLGCEPFVSTSSHQFQFQTVPSWSRRLKPRLKRCKGLKRSRWLSHWEWYKFNDEEKTLWKNVEKAWKLPWPQQVTWNLSWYVQEVWTRSRSVFFCSFILRHIYMWLSWILGRPNLSNQEPDGIFWKWWNGLNYLHFRNFMVWKRYIL